MAFRIGPDLSRNPRIFRRNPMDFLQFLQKWCIFGQIHHQCSQSFCHLAFVFIHIAGGTFILNISRGQSPVADPEEQRQRRPPALRTAVSPMQEHIDLNGFSFFALPLQFQ